MNYQGVKLNEGEKGIVAMLQNGWEFVITASIDRKTIATLEKPGELEKIIPMFKFDRLKRKGLLELNFTAICFVTYILKGSR